MAGELTGDGTTDLAYDGRFELGNFLKANVMRLFMNRRQFVKSAHFRP